MADQWEYKSVLCGGGDDMETTLAPLGAQGWEAVGFAPVLNVPSKWTEEKTRFDEAIIVTVTEWSAQTYRVLLKRRKL